MDSPKFGGAPNANDLLLTEIADRWAEVSGRSADLLISAMLKALVSGRIYRAHRGPGATAAFFRAPSKAGFSRARLVDRAVAQGVEGYSLSAETIAVWRIRRTDFANWYSSLATSDLRPRVDIGEFWPDGLAHGLIDHPSSHQRRGRAANSANMVLVTPLEGKSQTSRSLSESLREAFPGGVPRDMPLPAIREKIGVTPRFAILGLKTKALNEQRYDTTLKRLLRRAKSK
jgi:hypothetical protein